MRLRGRRFLVFPPASCRFCKSVHPSVKFAALLVFAAAAPLTESGWGVLIGLVASVVMAMWYCRPRSVILLIVTPICILLTIVGALMFFVGGQPVVGILIYSGSLILISMLGLVIAFSCTLAELAGGIGQLARPLGLIGIPRQTISLGIILAVRFFALLGWSAVLIHRAFEVRRIPVDGVRGIVRLIGALLIKSNRIVDDLAVAVAARGGQDALSRILSRERYSVRATVMFGCGAAAMIALMVLI